MNRMTPDNAVKLRTYRAIMSGLERLKERDLRLQKLEDKKRKKINEKSRKKASEKRQALLKAEGLLGSKFGFGW